jgi:hypothetical protein
MVIPSREDIEFPLLLEIEKVGGQASWRTLFQPVAAHFPGLTGKELEHPARLRWASYNLSLKEELNREGGIWTITDKGRTRLQQAVANKSLCKCGCGEIVPQGSIYVSGHDAKHRSKFVDKAGGVDNLEELLNLIDSYRIGDIGESELAKGIRRIRIVQP